jgi:hypothetical protein
MPWRLRLGPPVWGDLEDSKPNNSVVQSLVFGFWLCFLGPEFFAALNASRVLIHKNAGYIQLFDSLDS